MGKYNLIDEINRQVLNQITPDMKYDDRRKLRTKITDEVITKRAIAAGIDPDMVKEAWSDAAAMGYSFLDIEKKMGL